MKRLCLLALAALAAACSDGPSGPEPVGSVSILRGSSTAEEHTIQIGETLQLSAAVRDDAGGALTGREVTWSSSLESVATVSQTGLVTGVSVGETLVTATAEGVSDEVRIIVAAPATALACAEGEAGLSLAIGQVHTVSAAGSPVLCVAGGAGSEYVVVPFHSADAAQSLQVEVEGTGIVAAAGPPNPSLIPTRGAAASLSLPELTEDTRFHMRLREEERELFESLRRGGGLPGAQHSRSSISPSGISAAVAAVGDLVRVNVNMEDGQACTPSKYRWARVMAVSDRAVIMEDTLNPSGGFSEAEYAHLAETFDTLVYPTVTENFGVPTDIDDNGDRAVIFYTGAINEETPPNVTYYIGGLFHPRDLYQSGCPGSNQAEMFYLLSPDPAGEINGNERPKDFVARVTVATIAHEFQHLINASHRIHLVAGSVAEEVWLNEGLSHIAEELTYYAATPHEPGQNLGIDAIRVSPEILDRWNQYMGSNFGRLLQYLPSVRSQSLMSVDQDDDDLETRGAIWAFLSYMKDRHDGSDAALWKSLISSGLGGLANLNAALGEDALPWMRDWAVSLYTDDAVSTSMLYQSPSFNFRSIILGGYNRSTYPLAVQRLFDGEERDMTLQGGGAAYLRFGIEADGRAALRATSGGAPAPARLMISIVRTK